jgi:Uma2 family endonuclease
MIRTDPVRRMTLAEYLAFEEASPIKHEYVAGEVFAMSGVTTRHNLINLNLSHLLRASAKRRGCRVFGMEVKLRAAADRIYYPDLIVACGKAAEVDLIIEQPSVVVEITSPSTRATDRREKLEAYQRIPSLRTYIVVEQRRRQVILYTREADGAWRRDELLGSGKVVIPALDATLTLDEIYEDVPLPPLSVGEEDDEDYDWEDEPDDP